MKQPSLRFGTNIGHWLSQSSLDRNHLIEFFTEADVERIAAWGMDHIRLPVDYALFEHDGDPFAFSEEGLSWIDRAVEWTRRAGLWMVLDMHCLPGHHFMVTGRYNLIWDHDSPQHRRALAIWAMLDRRYRGQDHVVLEILNEPVARHDGEWNELAAKLHAVIRAQNPESWLMIPSNSWDNAGKFSTLKPVNDSRVVYTFHFYEPMLFTHQGAPWVPQLALFDGRKVPYPGPLTKELLEGFPCNDLESAFHFLQISEDLRPMYRRMFEVPYGRDFLAGFLQPVLEFREKVGAPVYCGEFGVITKAPEEDRLRWYADFASLCRENGIGMANWNYKSNDFGLVDRVGRVNERLLKVLQEYGRN
ncbi:MAG: glycoside hydrolase family 5 protein [Clostridia bacterium]|nr:glycoside hydrolase family 5 protein [Clostridia bacterium]